MFPPAVQISSTKFYPNYKLYFRPTPKYVLHYFDFRFRGEPARMIFNFAGVPFTDNRIKPQDFPAVKNSKFCWYLFDFLIFTAFPNGQVPLLQIDDKNLSQSNSIYRYLGKKYGEVLEIAFITTQK
jgi:hypothetical protein